MQISSNLLSNIYDFKTAKSDLYNYVGPFIHKKQQDGNDGFYQMSLIAMGMELQRCNLAQMMFHMVTGPGGALDKLNEEFINDYINGRLMNEPEKQVPIFVAEGKKWLKGIDDANSTKNENMLIFAVSTKYLQYNTQVKLLNYLGIQGKKGIDKLVNKYGENLLKTFVTETSEFAINTFNNAMK